MCNQTKFLNDSVLEKTFLKIYITISRFNYKLNLRFVLSVQFTKEGCEPGTLPSGDGFFDAMTSLQKSLPTMDQKQLARVQEGINLFEEDIEVRENDLLAHFIGEQMEIEDLAQATRQPAIESGIFVTLSVLTPITIPFVSRAARKFSH